MAMPVFIAGDNEEGNDRWECDIYDIVEGQNKAPSRTRDTSSREC